MRPDPPGPEAASFGFGAVPSRPTSAAATVPDPPLGALKAFTGTFRGRGFNTIFRPNSQQTPTKLPLPVLGTSVPEVLGTNVLELNLTEETLWFMPPLGSVPNRAGRQADIFLNGVPYLQVITDITLPTRPPVTIHVEPGLWMILPRTQHPQEPGTLVRMASIPHGTTIAAQGGSSAFSGKPDIPPLDITPFFTGETLAPIPPPDQRKRMVNAMTSQKPGNDQDARIPQDLTAYINQKAITPEMLCDPAVFIRNHSQNQNIISTVEITVNTAPAHPLTGGGIRNIAFLLGDPVPPADPGEPPHPPIGSPTLPASEPNAQAVQMMATFWVETVEWSIPVPALEPGHPPLTIAAEASVAGQPVPRFLIDPPVPVPAPRTIKAVATQIQYAQQVFLNFDQSTWPHVSVATLVPDGPVPIPASAWE
jgi:hypothetical protein